MATISIKECADTEAGQSWNVMTDGRIALEASTSPRKSCNNTKTKKLD